MRPWPTAVVRVGRVVNGHRRLLSVVEVERIVKPPMPPVVGPADEPSRLQVGGGCVAVRRRGWGWGWSRGRG